jgi:hypothetical protein
VRQGNAGTAAALGALYRSAPAPASPPAPAAASDTDEVIGDTPGRERPPGAVMWNAVGACREFLSKLQVAGP